MRVLIYGIANRILRSKFSCFIGEKYEVIGISDKYIQKDFLQGMNYIPYDRISEIDYDYIVLLIETESVRKSAKKELEELGINKEKIVEPYLFFMTNAYFTPDIKGYIDGLSLDKSYENIVMGLSYSFRGIESGRFPGGTVDVSWHSQDLYYNLLLLRELKKSKFQLYKQIENVFMVFPYYYFNYDMSKSAEAYAGGYIYANRGFDDFHNASSMDNDIIIGHLRCRELFGDHFWDNRKWDLHWRGSSDVIKSNDLISLSSTWKKERSQTIKENEELFNQLINEVSGKNIILIIPPFLTNYIQKEDMIFYYKMQELFYESIRNYSITVLDYSNSLTDTELFSDATHLNNNGRDVFTNMIISDIWKK